jgi:hypothetical protein
MIRNFIGILSLAVVGLLASANIAKADQLNTFTYSADGNTFVWQLPASPTPDEFEPLIGFQIDNVQFSENGGAWTLGSFGFYNFLCGGGFDLTSNGDYMINAFSSQLYSGPDWNPSFAAGAYDLTDYGTNLWGDPATLAISTPEPSSFALLGMGFLALLAGLSSTKLISARQKI